MARLARPGGRVGLTAAGDPEAPHEDRRDRHLDEERERMSRGALANQGDDIGVGELGQKEGPQRIRTVFEERVGRLDVVLRPALRSQPPLGLVRIGGPQGYGIEYIVSPQRRDPLRDPLASDEGLAAGEDEGSLAAYLRDDLVDLTPREFVPVRIAEFVETVDGERHEAVAHQHGKLIESHVQSQALQAERDEVLQECEYATPALNVKDEGTACREESVGARSGQELDEPGLSDAGRTVDQHGSD